MKNYIDAILEIIKNFFRKILQFGNEYATEETTNKVKDYEYEKDKDNFELGM